MTAPIPKWRLFIFDNLGSLFGAGVVLFWDILGGVFLLSAMVCPIWFFISVIRNNILGTEWRLAFFRAAVPALTLGVALTNTFVQWTIADVNGERIVGACESYYSDNGRYPKTLNELVPRYLPSIPRANYSAFGDFHYHNSRDAENPDGPAPILWWNKIVFLKKIYSFDDREWHQRD